MTARRRPGASGAGGAAVLPARRPGAPTSAALVDRAPRPARPTVHEDDGSTRTGRPGASPAEVALAAVTTFIAPISGLGGLGTGFVSLGLLAAAAFAPVLARRAFDTRGLTVLTLAFVACVPAGALLALVPSPGDMPRTSNWTLWLTLPLGAALTVVVVRYAVRTIGVRWTALAYAAGTIAQVLLTEAPRLSDPWWIKTRLSWPLVLAILALVYRARRPWYSLVALLACLAVAVLGEYRSLMIFLAAGALLTWVLRRTVRRRLTAARVLGLGLAIAAAVLVLYQAFAWAALSGRLGEEISLRSQRQVALGGTLLAGARIETPATLALMAERPLGFGPGFVPGARQAEIVLGALQSASSDEAVASYVHRYILGDPVRLHSLFGDLWFLFGVVGLVTVGAVLFVMAQATVAWYGAATRQLLPIVFLIWMAWDVVFSPAYSNLLSVAFLAALLAPAQDTGARDHPTTAPRATGRRR